MSTSSSSKMFELEASNGKLFQVEETVALQSETIKRMIEDDSANTTIRLPNVSNKILAMVIEYCRMHGEAPCKDKVVAEKILRSFDADFVNVDRPGTLCDLVAAADYLKIKSLLELIDQTADMIKEITGMTPHEIREKNRARDKKEDKVWRDNAWAFE